MLSPGSGKIPSPALEEVVESCGVFVHRGREHCRGLCRGVVVSIHVLTQQSYLANPHTAATIFVETAIVAVWPDQCCDFIQNGLEWTTALAPSRERHDTERAHVVASPHDRHVCIAAVISGCKQSDKISRGNNEHIYIQGEPQLLKELSDNDSTLTYALVEYLHTFLRWIKECWQLSAARC